jgi:hypothetical protein
LTLGQHSSRRLQSFWERDGKDAFTFTVLKVLVDAPLASAKRSEMEWINKIGSCNAVKGDLETQKFVFPPDLVAKLAEQNRTRGKTPEQRENMRQHSLRRWADPELRKPMLEGILKGNGFYKGMPSVRSEKQIAEHGTRMKEIWANPERSAKLKARQEARWKDPEAKARQAEKMRAYHAARRALKE